MPRQANGAYQQPAGTAAVSGTAISSTAFNTLETDIGSEITNSVDRLGRGAMQAALNLGSHQINAVAPGVAGTDAVNLSQLTNQTSFPTLTVTSPTGPQAALSGPVATPKQVILETSGLNRWAFGSDTSAESGSNAGSNFFLSAWTDLGVLIGNVISIVRATGVVAFAASPTVPTPATNDNSSNVVNSSWFANVLAGAITIGGTITAAAANFSGNVGVAGSLLSSSPSGGVGYKNGVGAGGAVTQATSKTTGVTLNTLAGVITMNNAALANGSAINFTLTDSSIAAADVLVLNYSAGTSGAYQLGAATAAGSAVISVRNNFSSALSEAIQIQFVVIKGATS